MLSFTVTMPEDETEQQFILLLYEQYKYIMRKIAKEFESATMPADDLIQEALVKLIEKAPVLMRLEDRALASYVVHTVRNTAIDRQRRRQTDEKHLDPRGLSEETETALPRTERPFEEDVLRGIQADAFQRVFAQLPERTQLLLRGKYQLALDDGELAKLLGCKVDSVRMLLTRARRQALELLEKEGYHDVT